MPATALLVLLCRRHERCCRLSPRAIAPILLVGNAPVANDENEMSKLRKRMNDTMVPPRFAERTEESYPGCVVAPARHTRCSPDSLDAAASLLFNRKPIRAACPSGLRAGASMLPDR